jgi:hypothetical protein
MTEWQKQFLGELVDSQLLESVTVRISYVDQFVDIQLDDRLIYRVDNDHIVNVSHIKEQRLKYERNKNDNSN